jgi:hypothetical protein
MRVSEEPVCIDIFRQNPVFTSLHLKYPVHVVPPPISSQLESHKNRFAFISFAKNPVYTSVHLRFPVHVVPPLYSVHSYAVIFSGRRVDDCIDVFIIKKFNTFPKVAVHK